MKKLLIVILIVLFVFAVIRIATSTYENIKRGQTPQAILMISNNLHNEISGIR